MLSICGASNINCGDSSCSYCISGYLYNKISCLPLCPTGYTQTSSPNTCIASSSQSVFSLNFFGFRHFSATAIDNFQHPLGLSLQDQSRTSPIPTNERGFYFQSSSQLVSNVNYILGPDLTFRFCLRIKSDGTIFEATSGGIIYFKIYALSGIVTAEWYLASSSASSIHIINLYTYTTGWSCSFLYSSQASGQFSMTISSTTTTLSGLEFRGQVSNMLMYFGGSTSGLSFTGFFHKIYADNSASITSKLLAPANSCEYNEFYTPSTGLCAACTACSETWPWCVRASCSICYSDSCSSCSGFGYEDCSACSNANTAPDCVLGKNCLVGNGVFNCITCSSGHVNIDGLCLVAPYAYNPAALSTPVISTDFNTFQQHYGGIFQSGSNGNTWGPFNSPDTDDPIPLKSRGLYFDGVSRYLVSTSTVALNYKSSVAIWTYPKNGYYPIYTYDFTTSSTTYCFIQVSNPTDYQMLYTLNSQSILNQWVFQAFSIDFSSNTVTVTYTDGSSVYNIFSLDGYAYYDVGSLMWVGKYSTFYYKGFIYSISIWQTAVTDYSTQFNTCGTDSGDSCIWHCDIGYYYNTYETAYMACDSSCTSGCATWGTCSQCLYPACASCSNFNTTCSSTVASPCVAGYVLGISGMCCSSACSDCYGPHSYNCLACSAGLYLLGQVCLGACPLGYIGYNGNCQKYANPFLNLVTDRIEDQVPELVQGIIFETGVDTGFYPNGKPSDPIPAIQRGYYFEPTSYMTAQSILLPYNFTMIFYIKQTSAGALLSKSSFTINTLGSVTFAVASVITATFPVIPSTDWYVIGFSIWTEMDGTTCVSLTIPSTNYFSQQTSASVIFLDTSSALILGAASGAFTGFLYQFLVYIYPQDLSTLSASMCSTSSEALCFWNCDILQYLNVDTCNNCAASCTNGCVRGTDCNFCSDRCASCTGFTSDSCTSCISHANLLDGQCTCEAGWYWDGLSCSVCDISCVLCTGPTSADCTCWDHSVQVGSLCKCEEGYYLNSNSCLACHSDCLTCFGPAYYECSSCTDGLLEVVCLSTCPIGFNFYANQCTVAEKWMPTVEFIFNTIQGVFYDKINNVGAMTGQSESYYPNLDLTDPVPAYRRGLYFTGKYSYLSMPYPPEFRLLFGIRFFVSVWINPISHDGTLLSKSQENNEVFSVSMQYLYLYLKINIDNIDYALVSNIALINQVWNQLLISVDYAGASSLALAINKQSALYSLGTAAPFMDSVGIPLYIGTASSGADYFQGFIYSIVIYSSSPSLDSLATTACDNCFICPTSGICIPTCNISTTYSSEIFQCVSCNSTCTTGCINSESCNLCDDPNCLSCSSSEKNSCNECNANYQVNNLSCEQCHDSLYYNSSLKTCEPCPGLCLTCLSEEYCMICAPNSTLTSNNHCNCNVGYSGNITCSRNKFTAFVSINDQNQATLTFTEALLANLTVNDITVLVHNHTQDYQLSSIDNYTYAIAVTFIEDIYSGDTINITFNSIPVSSLNSLLDISSLVADLFAGSYSSVVADINTLHSYAQIGLTIGISTVVGASIITLDPGCFFNFLNSVQIYAFIVLYQVNLDPGLVSFLAELSVMPQLPNPLAFFISSDSGVQITGRIGDYGNNTNLLLLNSGITLLIFTFCVLGKVCTYPLHLVKNPWVKTKVQKMDENYKYGVFSRFWIQSCLELFINSLIGIIYCQFANTIQIIDFILCCIMLVGYT